MIENNEDKTNWFGCGLTAAVINRHSHEKKNSCVEKTDLSIDQMKTIVPGL